MKKIMFSDKYGLTQAVLDGRKTMTRRIITCPKEFKGEWVAGFYVYKRQSDNAIIQYPCMYDADECTFDGGEILPKYKVGEVVAIAQRYSDIYDARNCVNLYDDEKPKQSGWNNKLFVRADLMPHHIRITDVKVERLQDISDCDCFKEGIVKRFNCAGIQYYKLNPDDDGIIIYKTPQAAFASLIDKVSGRGVWESNPWVFAYDFELVD